MKIDMNRKQKEEELIQKYDFLKRGDDGSPYAMFGFEVGDGWMPLLEELFAKLDQAVTGEERKDFHIRQIKEKFASLRVYTSNASTKVRELIIEAESKSSITCEICGKPGKGRRLNAWWITLCSYHNLMNRDNFLSRIVKIIEDFFQKRK